MSNANQNKNCNRKKNITMTPADYTNQVPFMPIQAQKEKKDKKKSRK